MNAQTQNAQLSYQNAPQSETIPQPNAPSSHASLYVGDLDDDVTEAMIYDKFSRIGTIISIRVCRDMISRKSLGYAYVNFSLTSEAEKAIDELNFDTIKGRQMRIMWSQRDPSLRKSGVGNLFIKNLDKKIQVRDLYDTFSAIGDILSCKIPVDEKGQSKGYGFVHFLSKEAADTAVAKLDGSILNEKKIYVGYFIPRNQRNSHGGNEPIYNNIYVKNFGDAMTEPLLRDMFKDFGEITSLYVPLNENGNSRGFGFVCFKDPKDAINATLAKNQTDYSGRSLFVGRAMKRSERSEFLRSVHEKKKADKSVRYPNGVNLYVKNLDDSIDEEKLRAEFAQHGNITSVKIMSDLQKRSKGFGFVCFSYPDEATKAVTEMNGKLLGGKPLYVALAQRKEERKVLLQNQIIQRQLALRTYPPNQLHPMMQPQQGPGFPPQINPAAFQSGLQFMYPTFANQANQTLMPGAFMSQVMANRMVQPVQQNRPRWFQPNNNSIAAPQSIQTIGQNFRPAYAGYNQPAALANSIRPQNANLIQSKQLITPPGQLQQQINAPIVPGARVLQPPNPAPQPIRGSLQQQPGQVQYVSNVRNIVPPNQTMAANSQMLNMRHPMPGGVVLSTHENGTAIKQEPVSDDGMDGFLNKYKSLSEHDKKQLLGDNLYNIIKAWYPAHVGKLTGMLLEIDNSELMSMIVENVGQSDHNMGQSALKKKVDAAMKVLSSQATHVTEMTASGDA